MSLIFDVFRYVMWQKKLLKLNISLASIETDVLHILGQVLNTNKKIERSLNQCSLLKVAVRDPDAGGDGGQRQQQHQHGDG